MEQEKEVYLVWQDGVDEQFYNQYFSLEDAVSSESKDAEIFRADLVSLGSFELKVTKKLVKKTKKGKK